MGTFFAIILVVVQAILANLVAIFDVREQEYQKKPPLTPKGWLIVGLIWFVAILTSFFIVLDSADRRNDHSELIRQINSAARPIDRVLFQMSFSVPLADPSVGSYKARLDQGLLEFARRPPDEIRLSKNLSTCTPDPSSSTLLFRNGDTMVGSYCLNFLDPLWPTKDEPVARDALSLWALELAFFKDPIDPSKFEVSNLSTQPRRPWNRQYKPDWNISAAFHQSPWRIGGHVPAKDDGYFIQLPVVDAPKSLWQLTTDKINLEDHLAGAQLMINLARTSDRANAIRKNFSVTHIFLQINGRSVSISPDKLTRRVSGDGNVFWEFLFAKDASLVFETLGPFDKNSRFQSVLKEKR